MIGKYLNIKDLSNFFLDIKVIEERSGQMAIKSKRKFSLSCF